ncbi:MAG: septal ring lytic transglycosylase RlpA family protein [Pseudomonadota bacterium]
MHHHPLTLFFLILCLGFLTSCSQTQFAAHMAKQIPLPGDTPKSVGSYKVGTPYKIAGTKYYPRETFNHTEVGVASWYGPNFHGKLTANGEIFDKNELTAAHRTLQMPSIIRVTNLQNGRSLILRVNDRGPFAKNRILDVSERAAALLGFKNQGTTKVKIELLPNESKDVAARAKADQDTGGYEIALNQRKQYGRNYSSSNINRPQQSQNTYVASQSPRPPAVKPVTQVSLSTIENQQVVPTQKPAPVFENTNNAPISYTPKPAAFNQNIYVQAGAFSQEQNALSYSQQLSALAPSKVMFTRVNNVPYYRVRLGPFETKNEAETVIASLIQKGNSQAVIVLDQ